MGVIRETAAAALSLWLCGCLSASEGSSGGDASPGDGGPDAALGDGGAIDPLFYDCPAGSVDYWGGTAGRFDGDDVDDVLLLRDSDDLSLRGIEIRLSSEPTPRCAFTPSLDLRGARAGDFLPGGDGTDEVLLLAFDAANRRHLIVLTGGVLDPMAVTDQISPVAEPGYTPSDPYDIRAHDGPSGWQLIYGGPSAALSDTESATTPVLHQLMGPVGEELGTVLAVALVQPADDDLRAFVATAAGMYWYDALAIVADGPINAMQSFPFDSQATAAAFGDFEPGTNGDDGCPDLAVAVTGSPEASVVGYDLTCFSGVVTVDSVAPFIPSTVPPDGEPLHLRAGNMDGSPNDELILFGLSGADSLFYDAVTEVRFDEDPDSVSWECAADEVDTTRQLCGEASTAQALAPEVDWVRTIQADVDGDDDDETVFVGVDDLFGCIDRQGPAFTACGQ